MLKLGIEPKTFALLARRSNQLSYSSTNYLPFHTYSYNTYHSFFLYYILFIFIIYLYLYLHMQHSHHRHHHRHKHKQTTLQSVEQPSHLPTPQQQEQHHHHQQQQQQQQQPPQQQVQNNNSDMIRISDLNKFLVFSLTHY